MKHNLTQHSLKRFAQRGFTYQLLNMLEICGEYEIAPGNARKIMIKKKEKNKIICSLKKLIQIVEKTNGKTLIIGENDIIITGYQLK